MKSKPTWFYYSYEKAKASAEINLPNIDYIHIYEFDPSVGRYMSGDNFIDFCGQCGEDYDEVMGFLTSNPSEEQLNSDAVIKELKKNYDGVSHMDYDPEDYDTDIEVLLLFDPNKHVKLINVEAAK